MKGLIFKSRQIPWVTGTVAFVLVLACISPQTLRPTQIIEVTQVVPETQVVESIRLIPVTQILNVTHVVPVTQVVQATKIVQVTQIVPVTHIVEIPVVVTIPVEVPVMLAPTEAPAPTAAPLPAATNPTTNGDLLVWYNFENDFMTSGVVSDVSGNGHHAQVYGNVNVDDGISNGNAILFLGDSYLLASNNPAGGRNTVSFSLWFKTDHPENNYKLASAAWWSGGPGSGWILATHIPEFWSVDTQSLYTPNLVNHENFFASDEWIHEVITYDGTRIREYTNGQLVNDWITTGAAIGHGQSMAIGAWPQFGFNFVGCIDEFKIFASSLTDQEVRTLYDQGR